MIRYGATKHKRPYAKRRRSANAGDAQQSRPTNLCAAAAKRRRRTPPSCRRVRSSKNAAKLQYAAKRLSNRAADELAGAFCRSRQKSHTYRYSPFARRTQRHKSYYGVGISYIIGNTSTNARKQIARATSAFLYISFAKNTLEKNFESVF